MAQSHHERFLYFILRQPDLMVSLANVIKADAYDDIAKALLCIYGFSQIELRLMRQMLKQDIIATKQVSTLLRENTVSTLLVSQYCRRKGKKYLNDVLSSTLKEVCERNEALEVDPNRVNDGQVRINQSRLIILCRRLLHNIFISSQRLPGEIKNIINFAHTIANLHFGNVKYEVAANIYFLRFLCPALVSPEQYGIRDSVPPNARRTLILLSKLLQNLAFDIKPQDDYKESYMVPLHEMMAESSDAMFGYMELLIHQTSDALSLSSQKRKESIIDDNIKQALNFLHYHLKKNYAKIESHYSSSKRGSRTVPVLMIMTYLKEELDLFNTKEEKDKKDKKKKKKKKKKPQDDGYIGLVSRSASEHITDKVPQEALSLNLNLAKQQRSMSVSASSSPMEEDGTPPPSPPHSPIGSPIALSPVSSPTMSSPIMSPILSPTMSPTLSPCLSPSASPLSSPRLSSDSTTTPEPMMNVTNSSPPSSPGNIRKNESNNSSSSSLNSSTNHVTIAAPQRLGDSIDEKVVVAPIERNEGEDMRDYVERLQAEVRVLQLRLQDEMQLRRSLNKVLVRITDDISTEVKLRVARELADAKRGGSKHDKKKKHNKDGDEVEGRKTRSRSTSNGDHHFFSYN